MGAIALLVGLGLGLLWTNPYPAQTKKWSTLLLQLSVIGLGFGTQVDVIARAGLKGMGYTLVTLTLTLLLGIFFGKVFGLRKNTALLISVGTAICGGSAIAATSAVLQAENEDVSISLAAVFCLNALALFLFPQIGHYFGLTQTEFGLWSALAVHDTSSVVGTTMQYGAEALQVGTTVKLARALWIAPVALALSFWNKNSSKMSGGVKIPWFIFGFLMASALVYFFPILQGVGHQLASFSKILFVITLFLIGLQLNKKALRSVGFNSFAMAVGLWLIVSVSTFLAIKAHWIYF